MSKVEKLKKAIFPLMKWDNYNELSKMLDSLIQAVRDEEYKKHVASKGNLPPCKNDECCDCPAEGTRYCPSTVGE